MLSTVESEVLFLLNLKSRSYFTNVLFIQPLYYEFTGEFQFNWETDIVAAVHRFLKERMIQETEQKELILEAFVKL